MSFIPPLELLCKKVPGARGAIFVDYDGELVQSFRVDPALKDYDLFVVGAHATPLLNHALKPVALHMVGAEGCTFIQHVGSRYAVVLLATHATVPALARHWLQRTAQDLKLMM